MSAPPPKRPHSSAVEVITLSDSDDDAPKQQNAKKLRQSSPVASSSTSTSLNLLPSRAQLEAERLARVQARQDDPSAPKAVYTVKPAPMAPKAVTISDVGASTASPTGLSSRFGGISSGGAGPKVATLASLAGNSSQPQNAHNHKLRFWSGAMKRVPNKFVHDSDSLSIADLVGPMDRPDLIKAIASTFASDLEWFLPHFNRNAELTLILHPPDKGLPNQGPLPVHEAFPRTSMVLPAMKGMYGSMHVKCIILFYQDYCRVVIPTANLIAYDWNQMDNAIYVHDFPRMKEYADKNPLRNPTHTSFSLPLLKLLVALGVPNPVTGPFREYNFSSSSDVCCIATHQGTHEGWDAMNKAGGLCGLASVVDGFAFSPGGKWRFEATGSSIGSYKQNWLSAMMAALSGKHPQQWNFSKQQTRPSSSLFDVPTREHARPGAELALKIVFPTQEEVLQSHGGAPGGGTLFCQPKVWNDPSFPRHLFHRGRSVRDGVLAHTKQIVGLHTANGPDGPKREGFIYQGSHNFTAAAWGTLQHPRGPQLQAFNWELGVVLKFDATSAEALEVEANKLAHFKRPLVPYSSTDVAWQQDLFAAETRSKH